ncbi:hypothetical protein GLOTRDRAFT_132044 [Gloeophyllum trabeum ATCC 11539]|uniref:Uncharacterized protein n=1 Tax=Gloeophyllum trabeum (strain ATCC 11539 / FP-39264 / Madison 617) TaxID=670483 RepID=S7PYT9_GLOTA|nr:uncharacterized protein GLOTRDRAFT_132044 [Gloeophyllum trabeum ATCC 11539]EPQ52811.1 hypothetical protein GLOTRDRAFT_132044 [Gloeophyllum trabeum ATCC 11539]
MTYIGVADGGHGFKFMRANNSIVTQPTALFDEAIFPKCPNTKRWASTRLQSAPKPADSQPENSDDDWITDDDEPDSCPPPKSQKGPGQDRDDKPAQPEVREPENPPSPPPGDPAQQDELRRPVRERKPVTRLGNIYGEPWNPVETYRKIESDKKWKDLVGEKSKTSCIPHQSKQKQQVPGPSSAPPPRDPPAQSPGASHEPVAPEASDQRSEHDADELLRPYIYLETSGCMQQQIEQ